MSDKQNISAGNVIDLASIVARSSASESVSASSNKVMSLFEKKDTVVLMLKDEIADLRVEISNLKANAKELSANLKEKALVIVKRISSGIIHQGIHFGSAPSSEEIAKGAEAEILRKEALESLTKEEKAKGIKLEALEEDLAQILAKNNLQVKKHDAKIEQMEKAAELEQRITKDSYRNRIKEMEYSHTKEVRELNEKYNSLKENKDHETLEAEVKFFRSKADTILGRLFGLKYIKI